MAFLTKAVVAICVVFVPAAAVGAVGVPVNAGDAVFAKPQPDTVDSVTAAGIVGLFNICANPEFAFQSD